MYPHPPISYNQKFKKGVERERKKGKEKKKKEKEKEKRRQQRHFCPKMFCNFNALFVKSSKNVDFVRASRKHWSIPFHFITSYFVCINFVHTSRSLGHSYTDQQFRVLRSWVPHPEWEQLVRVSSDPWQATSSIQIRPEPCIFNFNLKINHMAIINYFMYCKS